MKKLPNLSMVKKLDRRAQQYIEYRTWGDYAPLPKCKCAYCGTMNQPELRLDDDCAGCSAPLGTLVAA